jgi:hypothetical protein
VSFVRRQCDDLLGALRSRGVVLASMLVLGVLYLAGLLIPQRPSMHPGAFQEWRAARPRLVGVLEWTGLSDVYRSPLMYVTLGVFFASLFAVLWERVPRLVKRTRLDQGLPMDPVSLSGRRGTVQGPAPDASAALSAAARFLERRGYRVWWRDPGSLRAVRYRFAPLGFLLFHGAFALLLAGGISLDLTRYAARATVAEGESFDLATSEIAPGWRRPRIGRGAPEVRFEVLQVRPVREAGTPIRLEADLLFPGARSPRTAEVNSPIHLGSTSILVQGAGTAPLLTCALADGREDGAFVKLRPGNAATFARFDACGIELRLSPVAGGRAGSTRNGRVMAGEVGWVAEDLSEGLNVEVATFGGELTRGVLRQGGHLAIGGGAVLLAMPEVRRAVELYIVDEHGGALLWAAFGMAIVGLMARLVYFRREIVVVAESPLSRLLVAQASDGPPGSGSQGRIVGDLLAAIADMDGLGATQPVR